MISARDPDDLSSNERLEEVGVLLARGYVRILVHEDSPKLLADPAESEPSCDPVNGSEDKLKEVR